MRPMVRCGELTGKRWANKLRRIPLSPVVTAKGGPGVRLCCGDAGTRVPAAVRMNGSGEASVFHLLDGHHLGYIVAQHVFDPVLQGGP
jgi:hypothetical protein